MNVSPGPDAIDVIGFANPGFNGMEVAPRVYVGSFYVKGDYIGDMTISLVATSNAGIHYASIDIPVTSHSGNWTHVQYTLNPPAPAPNTQNSLAISFTAAKATEGSLNFNLISLFPPTYNSRPNGMRIDLMNVLNELNPSFLRWGGNELEGTGLAESSPRWKWNETIGPMIDRPGRQGTWVLSMYYVIIVIELTSSAGVLHHGRCRVG
jgi:alpha-N-arabinofuranosidase